MADNRDTLVRLSNSGHYPDMFFMATDAEVKRLCDLEYKHGRLTLAPPEVLAEIEALVKAHPYTQKRVTVCWYE